MSIEHTVVFRLVHAPDSDAAATFLGDAERILGAIPGVQDFAVRNQVSPKSDLTTQFSMRFDDKAAYDAYNEHPDHVAFVADRWMPEVAAFQEYDFVG
jgi:hypothetical protein